MSIKTRCEICSKKLISGIIEGEHHYCKECVDGSILCHRCKNKTLVKNECFKCYFTKRSIKCDICHKDMDNGKVVDGVFKCWFCADQVHAKKSNYELCKKCGKYGLQRT